MNAQETAEIAIQLRNQLAAEAITESKRLASVSFADESTIRAIGHGVSEASVIIWTPEMFQLASDGHDSFVGLHWSSIPQPPTPEFWYFKDFNLELNKIALPPYGMPDGYECICLALVPAGFRGSDQPLMVYVCYPGPELDGQGRLVLRILRVDSLARDGVLQLHAAQIFAAYAFTQLKLAAKEPAPIPRATRRRMERQKQPIPDTRIIQLRQRETGDGHQEGGRQYHHKWIVKGHWRRLHEPRKEDGAQVTFVHAYVKGPQDAPLLQPRESVYVVAR